MSELTENSHLQSNIKMPVIRGEIALIVIILINSLGVVLMLYSGSGISAISSVPYAFSLVFPKISLGTWTYIFQGLLVLSLMIMRKKFVAPYLFSFLVGFAFSEMLDIHEMWINALPTALEYRVVYFVISYLLICLGIALSNRCGLPIIPTDLFPRELTDITKIKYSKNNSTDDLYHPRTFGRTRNRYDSCCIYDGKSDWNDWRPDGSSCKI